MKIIGKEDGIGEKTAVALGIFDGVHRGHRLVISKALEYEKTGLSPAVFTFRTESIKKKHGRLYEYIFTNEYKLRLFEDMGIKYVYSPDFDEICSMDGEKFAEDILAGKMKAGLVVCGENFRFGRASGWGTSELEALGEKYGFEVKIVKVDGFSSEKYRQLLRSGEVDKLYKSGDGYILSAEVITGNKIGRTIDFPTINQAFALGQLVLRFGVYVTETRIFGQAYPSITNVGVKPTVGNCIRPLAETHIPGFSGDLYGQRAEVAFREFIRGEIKFSSVDMLKKQIAADVEYMKNSVGKD